MPVVYAVVGIGTYSGRNRCCAILSEDRTGIEGLVEHAIQRGNMKEYPTPQNDCVSDMYSGAFIVAVALFRGRNIWLSLIHI